MAGKEIFKGIEIKGKALWIAKEKILAVADLHIGYEQALNEQGILAPREMFKEIEKEIKGLLKLKPKIIVINGDLKHEFGRISRQEWKDVSNILDFLKKHAKKIILIKGNHDTILKPISRQRGIDARNFYIKKDVCFIHGHKMFAECLDKKIKTLIMGHRHPAIILRDKAKSESYKCFLAGRWKGKRVIIMPSFFPLVEGSDISADFENKLAFNFNLKNFEVYAIGDKVYDFGKLKKVRSLA
ncbi:metallophosphoesterase [Candidatus Pacearchaeota archaeon]|nr:metallophosphoesterase [Candidatus Pacearchaeota archaeon]